MNDKINDINTTTNSKEMDEILSRKEKNEIIFNKEEEIENTPSFDYDDVFGLLTPPPKNYKSKMEVRKITVNVPSSMIKKEDGSKIIGLKKPQPSTSNSNSYDVEYLITKLVKDSKYHGLVVSRNVKNHPDAQYIEVMVERQDGKMFSWCFYQENVKEETPPTLLIAKVTDSTYQETLTKIINKCFLGNISAIRYLNGDKKMNVGKGIDLSQYNI